MAQQTINIGTTANDGTGDPLRSAFDKVNDNFTELYSDDAGDVNSVNGATGAVVLDSDDISEGSSNLYNATHTGDVTGSTALTIANDVIDHDNLSSRYSTKIETSHATGALSVDWSAGTTIEFTTAITANIELDFTNFKQGQVLDIYGLTGAYTVTLDSDAATSETFNLVGGGAYDGASTNYLQVVCVDDSADAVFNYSISTYASDTIIGD